MVLEIAVIYVAMQNIMQFGGAVCKISCGQTEIHAHTTALIKQTRIKNCISRNQNKFKTLNNSTKKNILSHAYANVSLKNRFFTMSLLHTFSSSIWNIYFFKASPVKTIHKALRYVVSRHMSAMSMFNAAIMLYNVQTSCVTLVKMHAALPSRGSQKRRRGEVGQQ